MILLALVLGLAIFKLVQWLKPRRGAPRVRGSKQPWDAVPLSPSTKHVPDSIIVGVWMADDVNPKFIHRISLSESTYKTLDRLVDNEGYIYGTSPSS